MTRRFIPSYLNLADQRFIDPATGADPADPIESPSFTRPILPRLRFDDVRRFGGRGSGNLNSCLGEGPCNTTPARQCRRTDDGDSFDVFGYSQSAVVASLVKSDLIESTRRTAPDGHQFLLIANPMRPNGGILGRGFEGATIPFFGITFYGPTPNSCPSATPCTATTTPVCRHDRRRVCSTTSSAATHPCGRSTFWRWPTRSPHTVNCTAMSRTITSASPE